MTNPIETKTLPSGFRVEVMHDDDAMNPAKDWDMLANIVLHDRCRYNFGHKQASMDELRSIHENPANLVLPLYMYDHSGITIKTSPFSCQWDSGQVGLVYCTRAEARREFGDDEEKALNCMRGDVQSVDDYLTGRVYGFQVFDPDGDMVDSCWGFFGDSDYCMGEGVAAAEHHAKEREEEATERDYWANRGVETVE